MSAEVIESKDGFIIAVVLPGAPSFYYKETRSGHHYITRYADKAKIFKDKKNAEIKSNIILTDSRRL